MANILITKGPYGYSQLQYGKLENDAHFYKIINNKINDAILYLHVILQL